MMEKIEYVNFIPLTAAEEIARKINYRHEKQLEAKLRCIQQEERYASSILNKRYSMMSREVDRLYLTRQSCLSYISIGKNGDLCIQLNRKRPERVPAKTDKYLRPTMMSSSGTNRIFHKDRKNLFNTSNSGKDIKRVNHLNVSPVTRVKKLSESCIEQPGTDVRSSNIDHRRTSSLIIDSKYNCKPALERHNSIPNISNNKLSRASDSVDKTTPDSICLTKCVSESRQNTYKKQHYQTTESKHGNQHKLRAKLSSNIPGTPSTKPATHNTQRVSDEIHVIEEVQRENSIKDSSNSNKYKGQPRIRSFSATERKPCNTKRNRRPSSTKGSKES